MKKYQIKEKVPETAKKNLSKYSTHIQSLLFHRGIRNEEEAEKFFNPNYIRDTHDPMLLKDIKRAASRILQAIEKKENILIYSDYDADGIPGAVVLHDFFKKIGYENFSNYIPHRNDEGFGLNSEAIKIFAKDGVNLVITVDCGITDTEAVLEANKSNIDVIVTDHHLPGEKVPNAYAIVNPNQEGDEYPFKSLCGSAVAFKLVQVLIKLGQEKKMFNIISGWEKWLLDMVGLATISDMVSLEGENRALSYYGLLVLRKTSRLGLRNLYKEAKIQPKTLSEDDISFVITPRINAASRMDEVHTAFDLLRTENIVEAEEGAKRLTKLNNERKTITATMVKEIKKKLSKKDVIPSIIVSGNPKWKPSIVGLVAGKLADEYNKPVFLWGRNGDGEIRGSCRSDQRVDVHHLMQSLPEGFLNHFGGHKFSGGFGVSNDNVHFLEEKILESFTDGDHKESEEIVLIDGEVGLNDINWKLATEIESLAPYGQGNPKPVFILKNIKLPEIQSFGKHDEHLKLDFPTDNKTLSAISFFSDQDSFQKELKEGESVDLIASIEKSYFRNFPELRLRIIDIL
jgi:single-stranded-DNA-specific exonuclease